MHKIPDQVIVNEYLVNETATQGIAPHKDHVQDFGPVIATLSLVEGWQMRLLMLNFRKTDCLLPSTLGQSS
jgi:hypothetical protein